MNSGKEGTGQDDARKRLEEICKEREILWLQRFQKIQQNSRIQWMSRDSFFAICDQRAAAENVAKVPFKTTEWEYPVTLLDMRARIAEPPLFTPPDCDFPGPVERWYGSVGDYLFTLDYHYGLSEFYCESIDDIDVINAIRSALDEFFSLNPY